MANAIDGPWEKIDGRTWRLWFDPADLPSRYFDLEYRRREGDNIEGYYLFGPRICDGKWRSEGSLFDGARMGGPTASLARYEAFARVIERVAFPNPFDALRAAK